MGFFFRRSSSFGPFRFNFSKAGIGASVGVKGARLTLSPKGTTYITVGGNGFYYRRNLSASSSRPTQVSEAQTVDAQLDEGEIKTADVEDLLQSSKGELIESLNKKAQMFNPSTVIFVVAAICIAIGLLLFMSASPTNAQLTLPDPSAASERQANRADEYALLVARYGQPSLVAIVKAGTVLLRTATYEGAHLAITFVPSGCVDTYRYHEAHKNDIASSRVAKRRHGSTQAPSIDAPSCVLPTDKASTVIGYVDINSGSVIDRGTAEGYLLGMSAKSAAAPTMKTANPQVVETHGQNANPEFAAVGYNEETLKREQQRITDNEASIRKDVRSGATFLIVALTLLIPGVLIHLKNKAKRATRLCYKLTESTSSQQRVLDSTLEQLATSRAIWRVDSQSAITDWKRNAGAAYNVKREQISVRRAVPPRVESNIVPLCVDFGKLKMFFLPDQVLYWQRGTFASIAYKDLNFQSGVTRFIEEQVQTSDSRQVGSTWRYVRKDGGPDRRFNNNRQLPIMLYGVVTAVSSEGINLLLHTSNVSAASSFTDSFRIFQSSRDRLMLNEAGPLISEKKTAQEPPANATRPANVAKALGVLGLSVDANPEQIAIAYRHMAQMYHPDKVAGLGPEFQQLAEEKMKEINAAHKLVKQHLEVV